VFVFAELALGLGADSQGGRVGGEAFREIPLDLLELAEQLVVFGVRDCRTVENVVLVRSAGQAGTQLRRAAMLLLAGFPRRLRCLLIWAGTLGWSLPLLL
jgi:hypothetical protein